jgi:hypothetical protein
MRWLLRSLLLRLGSRTILTIGGSLFALNMLIPDPLPLVDEFLMLAGTILLSRWVDRQRASGEPGEPRPVGRGRTTSPPGNAQSK